MFEKFRKRNPRNEIFTNQEFAHDMFYEMNESMRKSIENSNKHESEMECSFLIRTYRC